MAANQYCTYGQVQEEFKDITFGDGSNGIPVTSSRVDRFCQEASAYIDGRVGLLYTTPINSTASPNSHLILQHIAVALVAKRLKPILGIKTQAPSDGQDSRGNVEIDPEKMLEEIVESRTLLADAVKRSSSDGVNSYAKSTGVEHIFKRDTRQW